MVGGLKPSTSMKITTVVPFPGQAPSSEAVKILSRSHSPALNAAELAASAAALELERRRLQEDAEALQLREENLREYEARLRALQSEMDAARGGASRTAPPLPTRTTAPFSQEDVGLDAAWQKLHRAREISEAEQAHLRDDRLSMHAFETELKQRETTLAAREARVAAQEQLSAAASPRTKREPIASQQTLSAFTRLTRAPFLIAESLRGKNGKDEAATEE